MNLHRNCQLFERGLLWIAGGIVAVFAVWGGVGFRRAYLQRAQLRSDVTQRELTSLAARLERWMIIHERMPAQALPEALRQITEDEKDLDDRGYYPLTCVLENRDAWGHTLIFEVHDKEHRVVIRSVGPNGKDNRGTEDDIQVDAVLPPG